MFSSHEKGTILTYINFQNESLIEFCIMTFDHEFLTTKYNTAGPRYTSYPAVPHWKHTPTSEEWKQFVLHAFEKDGKQNGISLYIHLPYCESLCTYCGCNTRITVNHQVEKPYIDLLCQEWNQYLALLPEKPMISEIHLGGGTPTFFQPENLAQLIQHILNTSSLNLQYEFSFEGHPNNTTHDHLKTLFDLGFKRVSFGVQDMDPIVQETIHRIQPKEHVSQVMRWAREIGYTSVNLDLIYGLPKQTLESIKQTFACVMDWQPDRIAFYSYAHVPWIKRGMRTFTDANLPSAIKKKELYTWGRNCLEQNGYHEIGMDHFALPTDPLFAHFKNKSMNRNFMGYTTTQSQLLIGLGVSAIGDAFSAFVQNHKTVEEYSAAIASGQFAHFKGHRLTEEEKNIRWHIRQLMCHFETRWKPEEAIASSIFRNLSKLKEMENDGLLLLHERQLLVTDLGKGFVRNICMAIDPFIQPETDSVFSQTV